MDDEVTKEQSPSLIDRRHIFLVGFMGSGKSTVGPILADELDRPFVDIDHIIQKQEGRSIAEIFDLDGEPRFREIERQTLLDTSGRPPSVVALGGGAFAQTRNRDFIAKEGRSVWLRVRLADAVERCLNVGGRPLARDAERFQKLFYSRLSDYSQAEVSIDTSDRTPSEISLLIVDELRRIS